MGWVVNATPQSLYPWERPGTHCVGGTDWTIPAHFYAHAYECVYSMCTIEHCVCVCARTRARACTYTHLHWKLLHPLCSWSGYRPVGNTSSFLHCAYCSVPFHFQSPWPVSTMRVSMWLSLLTTLWRKLLDDRSDMNGSILEGEV